MKLTIMILLVFGINFTSYSQGFLIIPEMDAILVGADGMIVDNDTAIIYGTIGMDSLSGWGQFFAQFDSLGNLLKTSIVMTDSMLLISSIDDGNIVKASDGGGYAVYGTHRKYNADSTYSVAYTYLLKMNHDLTLDFIKFYENPGYKITLDNGIIPYRDGFLLMGSTQKDGEHGSNLIVRYVLANGDVLWKKNYYRPDTYNYIYAATVINDNEVVILGNSRDNLPIGEPYTDRFSYPLLMAIDSLGDVKWKWNWAGEKTGLRDVAQSFIATPDGGFLIAGARSMVPEPYIILAHPLLTKLDADLNISWRKKIDSVDNVDIRLPNILLTPDSNYLISGGYDSLTYHGKYTLGGDKIWGRRDSAWTDLPWKIPGIVRNSGLLSSGSILSGGYTLLPDKNYVEWIFLMKLSANGCMDTLACWPVATVPEAETLTMDLQVYPNPATEVVHFSLSQDHPPSNGKIMISDLTGRLVHEMRYIPDDTSWELAGIPQGLYFYRLEVGGQVVDVGSVVVMEN